jgi:hypothetical protein
MMMLKLELVHEVGSLESRTKEEDDVKIGEQHSGETHCFVRLRSFRRFAGGFLVESF